MKIAQAPTAIACYHNYVVPHVIQPQQQIILDVFACIPKGSSYTIGEIARITKLDKSAVSGRRNAMLKVGLLELGDERPCFCSGKNCQTVRLPAIQRSLFG